MSFHLCSRRKRSFRASSNILAQFGGEKAVLPDQAGRFAHQLDLRFATRPLHMDMRGIVVIRVDDEAETVEPVNRYHT